MPTIDETKIRAALRPTLSSKPEPRTAEMYARKRAIARANAAAKATTKAKKDDTTKEAKVPETTLKKLDKETILVTAENGTKHMITFVNGIPASVSGIGSLSKSFTDRFTQSQIDALSAVAYEQREEVRQSEITEAYEGWTDTINETLITSKPGEKLNTVHYRNSLTGDVSYAVSEGSRDTVFGIYSANALEYTSARDGKTYNRVLGVQVGEGGQFSMVEQTRYVMKDIKPRPDSELNDETPDLTFSDYTELYARGRGRNQAKIHEGVGLYNLSHREYLESVTQYYNRFKMVIPDAELQRSFAHVFFVKPQCNIRITSGAVMSGNSGENMQLDPAFSYAWNHSPEVVRELAANMTNSSTDFSFLLSNAAASFSLSDEYIDYESYGKGYTGYKVAFGRHDAESKTAGDFTVTFKDDNEFNIYRMIKLWVDYISGVYRGKYGPKDSMIKENILDYAGACYYILTAEDGETILFWSKYYGVFPTTIPSNQYSWSRGTLLSSPEIDIKFAYSFKCDYRIHTLVEFNRNARLQNSNLNTVAANTKGIRYEKTYNPETGYVGKTWVGAPFIESEVINGVQTFKLRFRQSGPLV